MSVRGVLTKKIQSTKYLKRVLKSEHTPTLLLLVGSALILVGIPALWRWYSATHRKATPITPSTSQATTTHPDESPVKVVNYQVSDDRPRQILISRVGIKGYVQEVPTDSNNNIGVPSNIHLAGWYNSSPLPGQTGVSIIDGHVHGIYNSGIFQKLGQVKLGDVIDIQFGDHTWKHFVVQDTDLYSVKDTRVQQFKQLPDVTRQLTLITCGGTFNSKTNSYEKRVIVRASLK